MRDLSLFFLFLFLLCSSVISTFAQEQTNAYFGNLHQHTGYSFDAFEGAHRHQPEKTYKYAHGDTINYEGEPLYLQRPLDFLAISDHAEYLGVFPYYDEHPPNHVEHHFRKMDDGSKQLSHWQWAQVFFSMYTHNPVNDFQNQAITKKAWQHLIDLADQYYQPGEFTTFAAFEWTAMSRGFLYARDQHRCVIFRSTDELPDEPYCQFDSYDPEDLWKWLDEYRQQSGKEVLAIPHNMNRSGGKSFSTEARTNGQPFTKAYAEQRVSYEMIQEVVQRKGQSMEHPDVSPKDRFADFNIREEMLSFLPIKAKAKELPNSYARQGLKKGLLLKDELGVNPFKFGVIGSTDSHDGLPWQEEQTNRGLNIQGKGIAGVWAEKNTRQAIFDALKRRETFATSGTRTKVRFFGGWHYTKAINFNSNNWTDQGYQNGVPMGGELAKASSDTSSPRFLIWAKKDPKGANLERVQVVKLWLDDANQLRQHIYNIAWSGNRQQNQNGGLDRIVDSKELEKEGYDHTKVGSPTLHSVWQDPDFKTSQRSAYYVRVLEVPDKFKGKKDRAWTSPIWYKPDK